MILFLKIFLVYAFYLMKSEKYHEETNIKEYSLPKSILFIVLGLAGLLLGGMVTVFLAVEIARNFYISERIIGLIIISVGTSLPELITSVTAVLKKNTDIAVGNIVGSNIDLFVNIEASFFFAALECTRLIINSNYSLIIIS